MAYTDSTVSGAYAFPQDGASAGINDFDADWQNAAYVGGLAKAQGTDYVDTGMNISASGGTATVSPGLAFIEDTEAIDFRNWDDSEQVRSGTWTQGYLVAIAMEQSASVSLGSTDPQYIYLAFDRSAQNSVYLRSADSKSEAPTKSVLLGTVSIPGENPSPLNRQAGYSWQLIKKTSQGFQNEFNFNIPSEFQDFDEYKVKFIDVQGQGTSGNQQLFMRFNGFTSGYWFRTTQNNTQNATKAKLLQGRGDQLYVGGHLYFSQARAGDDLSFDNRLTSNEEKQYAFAGHNVLATGGLKSMNLYWSSGQKIAGAINVWARNRA